MEPMKENGSGNDKAKRKPFKTVFHRGIWWRNDSESETAPLTLYERSYSKDFMGSFLLVATPIGERPDTKHIKKMFADGTPTDFFIDKVLGENIKVWGKNMSGGEDGDILGLGLN
ncbi:hypothetical protein GQ457_11G021860 [Hibiscus cannabinus]